MNKTKFIFIITLILFVVGAVAEFSNIITWLIYWAITGCFIYFTYTNFRGKSDKEICKELGLPEKYLEDAE